MTTVKTMTARAAKEAARREMKAHKYEQKSLDKFSPETLAIFRKEQIGKRLTKDLDKTMSLFRLITRDSQVFTQWDVFNNLLAIFPYQSLQYAWGSPESFIDIVFRYGVSKGVIFISSARGLLDCDQANMSELYYSFHYGRDDYESPKKKQSNDTHSHWQVSSSDDKKDTSVINAHITAQDYVRNNTRRRTEKIDHQVPDTLTSQVTRPLNENIGEVIIKKIPGFVKKSVDSDDNQAPYQFRRRPKGIASRSTSNVSSYKMDEDNNNRLKENLQSLYSDNISDNASDNVSDSLNDNAHDDLNTNTSDKKLLKTAPIEVISSQEKDDTENAAHNVDSPAVVDKPARKASNKAKSKPKPKVKVEPDLAAAKKKSHQLTKPTTVSVPLETVNYSLIDLEILWDSILFGPVAVKFPVSHPVKYVIDNNSSENTVNGFSFNMQHCLRDLLGLQPLTISDALDALTLAYGNVMLLFFRDIRIEQEIREILQLAVTNGTATTFSRRKDEQVLFAFC